MLTATTQAALNYRRAGTFAYWLKRAGEVWHIFEVTLAPFLDLAIRLWLAQLFWVSGVLKLANWDTAVALATYEYPVAWMDPLTAATLGVAIEISCPILLALGLATRAAAIPLLILSFVIQFEYQPLNEPLYWSALFGWYVVMGAGPFSLDRWLAPGLNASAVPLVGPLSRLYTALTRYFGPCYKLLLRCWLAALLFAPVVTGWPVLNWLLGFAGLFIALGLTTRPVALSVALLLVGMGFTVELSELQRTDFLYWFFFLTLLAFWGPGPLALDNLLRQQLRRYFPQIEGWSDATLAKRPHVVVIGAGFGGLKTVYGLRLAACRITLIDKRNYHLFQPLLYQVATASLSPADIATPIRALFREQPNVRVVLGEVVDVDTALRQVILADQSYIHYDYLVLATGARHSYFGRAPFRYRHFGNLATIGRKAAVVDFSHVRLSGAAAWWLWGIVHILFLVDVRKRLSVALEWLWAYLTFKHGTRLSTGGRE